MLKYVWFSQITTVYFQFHLIIFKSYLRYFSSLLLSSISAFSGPKSTPQSIISSSSIHQCQFCFETSANATQLCIRLAHSGCQLGTSRVRTARTSTFRNILPDLSRIYQSPSFPLYQAVSNLKLTFQTELVRE